MESLITAAARALEAGDPLGALNRVALRNDAPSLALRGIAMAQLGDLAKAKSLLRNAARAFGPREAVARARCVVAEAEIALVSRDLSWPDRTLAAARTTLEKHGDLANAAHAEEAADADHGDLDVAVLVHQQVVDGADVLVGFVIHLQAVHLGRTPLAGRRGRGGRGRGRSRGGGRRRLVGGGGRCLRERNGRKQCSAGKTGDDRLHHGREARKADE